jgi:hypothetical protein
MLCPLFFMWIVLFYWSAKWRSKPMESSSVYPQSSYPSLKITKMFMDPRICDFMWFISQEMYIKCLYPRNFRGYQWSKNFYKEQQRHGSDRWFFSVLGTRPPSPMWLEVLLLGFSRGSHGLRHAVRCRRCDVWCIWCIKILRMNMVQ